MDLLSTSVSKQRSDAQFSLALANHNNNQLYFSPSKTLSLTPNVTVEELRDRVQQIHDITCGYCYDSRHNCMEVHSQLSCRRRVARCSPSRGC
ncbi:hypothetical protein ARMGADRAFT_1015663 [Armillaria gallica]|uniref:Uncharacterized protein n=1 Tax=Armillaria gallica TaxID=47427 RepID=A0A2H3D0Z4_ARMGA|nr:hypothetical protein ARMGADRAFT_1015663 [Armillaria gallica]